MFHKIEQEYTGSFNTHVIRHSTPVRSFIAKKVTTIYHVMVNKDYQFTIRGVVNVYFLLQAKMQRLELYV